MSRRKITFAKSLHIICNMTLDISAGNLKRPSCSDPKFPPGVSVVIVFQATTDAQLQLFGVHGHFQIY